MEESMGVKGPLDVGNPHQNNQCILDCAIHLISAPMSDEKFEEFNKWLDEEGYGLVMLRLGNLNENGKLHGYSKTYFDNGNLWLSYNYKDDKVHGTNIEYFRDGSIHYQNNSINGEIEGQYERYYENGQLWYRSGSHKGKRHGKFEK